MQTIGTFDDASLTIIDVDVPTGTTQRTKVLQDARSRNSCSIELHITGAPANCIIRALGQNSDPVTDTDRLLLLNLDLPDLSALAADYHGVFLLPMYTAYFQLELQSVSGNPVHWKAIARGTNASFDDKNVGASAAAPVQLAAGSNDAGTVHVYALPPHQAQSGGALVAQAQAYAAPCTLDTVAGYNASPSMAYVQLHDKATAISLGDAPKVVIPVPGGRTSFSLSMPFAFAVGMSIGISTTELTYTSAGNLLAYESVVRA